MGGDLRAREGKGVGARLLAGLRLPPGRWMALLTLAACGTPGGDPAREAPRDEAVSEAPGSGRAVLLNPEHPAWSVPAPDTSLVRFETSRGNFVVRVVRAWAPRGADRFVNLVRHGYYDDARFHRAVPGFVIQWGIAGDPEVSRTWRDRVIPDDPVVVSNTRGRVAFAFTEPGTRSTQVFVALVDLSRLDEGGFAPFGEVVEGMGVVESLHTGYGEESGGGMRAGAQDSLFLRGNDYLDRAWPLLDRIHRALSVG